MTTDENQPQAISDIERSIADECFSNFKVFCTRWKVAQSIFISLQAIDPFFDKAAADYFAKPKQMSDDAGLPSDIPPSHSEDAKSLKDDFTLASMIASIAILHQAFEDYLIQCIQTVGKFNPDSFSRHIINKSIKTEHALSLDHSLIMKIAIGGYIDDLSKDSLPKKWDAAINLCPPFEKILKASPPYDRKWIERFDKSRHSAVHGDAGKLSDFSVKKAISKLIIIASYFLLQTMHTCGCSMTARPDNAGSDRDPLDFGDHPAAEVLKSIAMLSVVERRTRKKN